MKHGRQDVLSKVDVIVRLAAGTAFAALGLVVLETIRPDVRVATLCRYFLVWPWPAAVMAARSACALFSGDAPGKAGAVISLTAGVAAVILGFTVLLPDVISVISYSYRVSNALGLVLFDFILMGVAAAAAVCSARFLFRGGEPTRED